MEVQYYLTESDYAAACWVYFRLHPWRSLLAYRYPAVIAFAAMVFVARNPDRWRDAGFILAISAGLLAYISMAYRWSWRQQFRRLALAHRLISGSVDAESIRLRGEGCEIGRRWEEIADVIENRRLFIFGVRRGRVLVLPKGAMDESQIRELRGLVAANARGKGRLAT